MADVNRELSLVRASAHRLAALGVDPGVDSPWSLDGWTRAEGDLAAVAASAGTPACRLAWGEGGALTVTVYEPSGAQIGPLGPDADRESAVRASAACGFPDGADLLLRALTVRAPFYTDEHRLVDACRALGVPPDALDDVPTQDGGGLPPSTPDVGVVLVRADPPAAAADAPLTGQSAWTVPAGPGWSLHLWDGEGSRAALPVAALDLSHGHQRFAIAFWWSPDRSGFLLARRGRAVAAHEWGGEAVDGEASAAAGRALAETFHLAGSAPLWLTALLRRRDLPPQAALTQLLQMLRVPANLVGRSAEELAAWASRIPWAIRTPRLGLAAAIAYSFREEPPDNAWDAVERYRPGWYRVLNGVIALVMAFATVILFLNWRWDHIPGWWVALGVATTASFAWGVRRPRPSRMRPNLPITEDEGPRPG